jgi:AraC-like DNA-binding protein
MGFSMPEYFLNAPTSLSVDGSLIADYRTVRSELRTEVFASTSYLIFVLSGTKTIVSHDVEISVRAGDFVFLKSGRYIVSHIVPPEGGNYYALVVFLHDSMIRAFAADYPAMFGAERCAHGPLWFKDRTTPLLKSSIESLLPYFSRETKNTSLILKHKFYEIILNLFDADRSDGLKNIFRSVLADSNADLRLYMEKSFFLPYTLEEFANNTFRSLSRFKKEFGELYGTTPKRWINERRLERAKQLIGTNGTTITEVAYLCGFESLSHFIKLFREKYGSTPKQMQNLNR